MAQVAELKLRLLTLLGIKHDTMFLQAGEHLPEMNTVLLLVSSGHQNVVHVTETEVKIHQHLIHYALECLPSPAQAKCHSDELK